MWARAVVRLVMAVLIVTQAGSASALETNRSIVRIKTGLDGLKVINTVCNLLGCDVLRALDVLPGETGGSLFLVKDLPLLTWTLNTTLGLLGVASVEPDLPVAVTQETWGSSQASAAVLDQLWNRDPMSYYGTTAWESYLRQPAADIVRARQTHCTLRQTGAGIVAVIDTGVDTAHPTLRPFLVDGYDFTRDAGGGNETADVGQASAAVLDGVYCVNQASAAVLDQASAAVLDDPDHAAFGHGTMVAGVIHLVAPTARIMPLKAFYADGQGYTSDILRAVYYATQKGAKVLNMSFSRPTSSAELKRAIDNATSKGLVAVASAGNNGTSALMYPAAYDNVMGVASTSNTDTRSTFSNYGSKLVWVAAPGEGIITTYPWGSFAAAWGTSFSTPFVSGAAALLAGMQGSATNSQVASAVANAKPLSSDMGYGRLDLYKAVQAGRSLWPNAPVSPVPDSCSSSALDWTEAQ